MLFIIQVYVRGVVGFVVRELHSQAAPDLVLCHANRILRLPVLLAGHEDLPVAAGLLVPTEFHLLNRVSHFFLPFIAVTGGMRCCRVIKSSGGNPRPPEEENP